jgi:hypothetical protein
MSSKGRTVVRPQGSSVPQGGENRDSMLNFSRTAETSGLATWLKQKSSGSPSQRRNARSWEEPGMAMKPVSIGLALGSRSGCWRSSSSTASTSSGDGRPAPREPRSVAAPRGARRATVCRAGKVNDDRHRHPPIRPAAHLSLKCSHPFLAWRPMIQDTARINWQNPMDATFPIAECLKPDFRQVLGSEARWVDSRRK